MPTITLNIPNTTFVSSALPDNNFSFYPLLFTGTDPNFHNCISLLQISLPSLSISAVDSAVLELAVVVKSDTEPSPVVVSRVTAPFNKDTVTYNTRPSFTATPSQINIETSDLYSIVQIDVTSLVNEWLDGTYANNGIALTNSDGTTEVEFGTNNIVYEPYFPKLTLTFPTTPEENTAICFSYAQLAHIIEQLILMYPTNIMTVYTNGFKASGITGTPYRLFSSQEGTYGALFILMDNGQQEVIPLNTITAIYTGDATVYNPAISYLKPPKFPAGCDTDLITAYYEYLPVSTEVLMYLGAIVEATGIVYKNEYDVIVLSDTDGNTPVFIPVTNITAIFPTTAASATNQGSELTTASLPKVKITANATAETIGKTTVSASNTNTP